MSDRLNPEALAYFRKQGARGGKKGGKSKMRNLTPAQRSEFARIGGKARWKDRNGESTAPAEPGTSAKKHVPTKKETS